MFVHCCIACVCVVGMADKQAVGWGGGRSPPPQIIDTILAERGVRRSKKSGWPSSALQSDPLHPTHSARNAVKQAAGSIYSYTSPCDFFFLLCNNRL